MTHGKTALLCLILSASCMGQIPVLGSGGSGGGSGTITSVTLAGTANQITATGTCTVTTTGTCTLSLPSGLVLPGTINGLTVTTTTGTLTIASAKVATVSNSLTLAGTDGVTITFPTTNATIARTDAAQTFTGTQTFSSPIAGSVTGSAATTTGFTAGAGTLTGPAVNGVALIDTTYKALATGPLCNTTSTGVPSACVLTVNVQSGTSYTLLASDLGKIVSFTNSSPITVTVPLSLVAGFNCMILQSGTGTVTVVAAGGVTLNLLGGLISTSGQNALALIMQTATNTYVLGGSLQ